MRFIHFSTEDIVGGLTNNVASLVDPVLDELLRQKNKQVSYTLESKEIKVTADYEGQFLRLNGVPMHDRICVRLLEYATGTKRGYDTFWLQHFDLFAQVVEAAIKLLGDILYVYEAEGEILVIAKHQKPFYGHYDYFEPVLMWLVRSHKTGGAPMSLAGYQLDPIWAHVEFVTLGQGTRTKWVGFEVDANYLFKPRYPRAFFRPLVFDIKNEVSVSAKEVWDIASPAFTQIRKDFLKPYLRQLRIYKNKYGLSILRQRVYKAVDGDPSSYAEKAWKQKILTTLRREGIANRRLVKAAVEFEGKTKLDFICKVLSQLEDYSLLQRQVVRLKAGKIIFGE